MQNAITVYKKTREKLRAYEYAMWVLSWDQETETPVDAFEYRTQYIKVLNEEIYDIESNKEYLNAVKKLYENRAELDNLLALEVKIIYKKLRPIFHVPRNEYIEYNTLLSYAPITWEKAKNAANFGLFLPTLEKIVAYNKKLIKYLETDKLKGYDVLLDLYEEGYTSKEYDEFFAQLKEKLVPFVANVVALRPEIPRKLFSRNYDVRKQIDFSNYLLDVFHFDLKRGVLKQSPHPMTSAVSSTDVRITTRYAKESLETGIYSTLHELGHGIYDQNISTKFLGTALDQGASLGFHESQSRFYENMVGRSFAFWETHYKKLQEIFAKELKDVTLNDFYLYVNVVQRTLIRIDADELTYPLHIMVRYEIEKQLFNGKLKVANLAKKWRLLMQEYVGGRPKNDAEGVLQDIHWSFGMFGYFPTYALGSAIAAQLYHYMNKDFDVENSISGNDMKKINEWLRIKVHQFGASKTPKELILEATGEEFNTKYYIDYLFNKFSY